MVITEFGVLDEVEFRVDAGKIREFALATFVADPVHTVPAAALAVGFPAQPATPTHVVVAGHYRDQQAMVDALGLRLARVVVGSVSWSWTRPLVAGDELRGVRRVVGDERRDGKRGGSMRLVTLETQYLDPSGTSVVQVREVLIERGDSA
jgi:acyl dehydratase